MKNLTDKIDCLTISENEINLQILYDESCFAEKKSFTIKIYNDINGSCYKISYSKKDKKQIFFNEIKERIIIDVVDQMIINKRLGNYKTIDNIIFSICTKQKNTIYIKNKDEENGNIGYLCYCHTIFIDI